MNVNHSNLWSIGWRMGKSDYFWWLIFTSQHIPNTTIVCTLSKLITGTKRLEKSCSPKRSQELSTKSIQKCYEINDGFFGYRRDNHTNKFIFYLSKFTRHSSWAIISLAAIFSAAQCSFPQTAAHIRTIFFSTNVSSHLWGGELRDDTITGGGQNTDPQSMDYPKMDYATEV